MNQMTQMRKIPTHKIWRHTTSFEYVTICTQNESIDSNEQRYQRTKIGTTQLLLNSSQFVCKMNQMNQMIKNINAQNLAQHNVF